MFSTSVPSLINHHLLQGYIVFHVFCQKLYSFSFTSRFVIHCELVSKNRVEVHFFPSRFIQLFQHHLLKKKKKKLILSLLNSTDAFVENKLTIPIQTYFYTLYSVLFIYLPQFSSVAQLCPLFATPWTAVCQASLSILMLIPDCLV